jgi:hypothetical protein
MTDSLKGPMEVQDFLFHEAALLDGGVAMSGWGSSPTARTTSSVDGRAAGTGDSSCADRRRLFGSARVT